VPLTRPWFAGIANIRGNLHAVGDFSVFCGGPPIVQNANARLLLIGSSLWRQCRPAGDRACWA
jgi:twitching motility protein PilI